MEVHRTCQFVATVLTPVVTGNGGSTYRFDGHTIQSPAELLQQVYPVGCVLILWCRRLWPNNPENPPNKYASCYRKERIGYQSEPNESVNNHVAALSPHERCRKANEPIAIVDILGARVIQIRPIVQQAAQNDSNRES